MQSVKWPEAMATSVTVRHSLPREPDGACQRQSWATCAFCRNLICIQFLSRCQSVLTNETNLTHHRPKRHKTVTIARTSCGPSDSTISHRFSEPIVTRQIALLRGVGKIVNLRTIASVPKLKISASDWREMNISEYG